MEQSEIISKIHKKIGRMGDTGVIFITQEMKKLGWKQGDEIVITALKEGKLVIEKE